MSDVARPMARSAMLVRLLNEPPVRNPSAKATWNTRRALPAMGSGLRGGPEEDLLQAEFLGAHFDEAAAALVRALLDALDLLQALDRDLEALLAGRGIRQRRAHGRDVLRAVRHGADL